MLEKLKRWLSGAPADPAGTPFVTIVSGLPRSGTSMMMGMLEAGGIDPVTDEKRQADEDNPKGYYEFERVKRLDKGDVAWVPQARGQAVKVISALLRHLPEDEVYKVLFMRRHLDEVLASQKRMLERRGEDPEQASDEELAKLFEQHIQHVRAWSEKHPNVDLLEVSYNEILEAPQAALEEVAAFLEGRVEVEAMVGVLDPELYRQRATD